VEPREVLREFGLELPENRRIAVHDSSADLRYLVLPQRPEGTEGTGEDELAALVTRDSLVGTDVPRTARQDTRA
jgi:nitrile hydratase